MCRRVLLSTVIILMFSVGSAVGQDQGVPDTVYFGDNGKAYGYEGGVFKVPIYIFTDSYLYGLNTGMEYGMGGIEPTWDSVSLFGSIMLEGDYLDLTGLVVDSVNGINGFLPDTVLVGGAALPGHELPPGRYLLCNIWFSGGSPGEEVTVDSAFVPPGGEFIFATSAGNYTPQFLGGTLTIEFGAPEIYTYAPDQVSGDAATTISFEVTAAASYPPASIAFDSLINLSSGLPPTSIPSTSGTNPLLFEWLPTYEEYGQWVAWFSVCDATMNCLDFTVPITVNFVQPPCDVMRGDTDCNDIINISDVVYLINYIFGQGPAPGCSGKE